MESVDLAEEFDPAGERVGDAGAHTKERLIEELDDRQKAEVIAAIGENVVSQLDGEQAERLAKDVGRAVINHVPVLSQTYVLRAGVESAVDRWLERNSDEIVDEVGEVIAAAVVEARAQELVDDGIDAVVDQIREVEDGSAPEP
ncbi:MAG: hypothetical protein ACLFMT_04500 [Halobacteriales archaeon]